MNQQPRTASKSKCCQTSYTGHGETDSHLKAAAQAPKTSSKT